MILSSNLPKLCCNNKCRKLTNVPREAWKCENGYSVELCEGCYVTFKRGKFCGIYHDKSNGWKRCISCEKPIHYGCIASRSLYVVSRPRGIKCLDCTTEHEILMANDITLPRGTSLQPNFEGSTSNSVGKTAPLLLNSSNRPQIQSTTPCVSRLIARGHKPSPPLGDRRVNEAERLVVGSSNISATNTISGVNIHCKELTTPSPTSLARVPPTVVGKGKEKVSEKGDERSTPPPVFLESNKGNSSTGDKDRIRKPRSEHRYVPRLTEQELKEMSRGSNVKVIPLFEKVLTVSDTGKIGRLVLPKKCAEGYFPSIDIPEGKPVEIQDLNGKDWEFNFRYWPNNNSRMYVLEGFNYYVTSMKLKPGDTVMFGRLEPEGKLVIGHRNATSASSSSKIGLFREAKTPSPSKRKAKLNMVIGSTSVGVSKGTTKSTMFTTFSKEKQNVMRSVHSDVVEPKSSIPAKRKRSKMGMVTESTTNEVLRDKTTSTMPSTLSHKTNDPINIHSDVRGSISSIRAKKQNSEMGMVESTTNGVLKDKITLTTPSTLSHEIQNNRINIHSDVRGSKSCIRANRRNSEMGIERTTNGILKDKTTSIMTSTLSHEKTNDPVNIHLEVRGSKSCIRANRKNSEMGIERTTNGILKDKTTSTMTSTLSHEKTNDPVNILLDVCRSKSYIRANRKNSEMGIERTTNGILKDKTISTMTSTLSHEKTNDPVNIHLDVRGSKSYIRANRKNSEMGNVIESTTNGVLKDKTISTMPSTLIHEIPNDSINIYSDVRGSKSCLRTKRTNSEKSMPRASIGKRLSKPTILALPCIVSQEKRNGSKSVHSKSSMVGPKVLVGHKRKQCEIGLTSESTDNENKMANLALSFEGGQKLIRPCPGSNPPSKMVLDGVKLKSYKDDPIIGRPSMFKKLDHGIVQWAQCDKCYKWRKVPVDAEISANWTCRQNHWDPLRLRCSAKEELTQDIIKNIFSVNNQGSPKKMKTRNVDPERVETVKGLDVAAITRVENGVATPQPPKTNKKHPRHRVGCACIVCMQAPSRSKHKPSCECCRCTSTEYRRVLNPRRGKKRSKNARRKLGKTRISTSIRKTQKALPQPEDVPKPPEIGTSNSNHQTVVIVGSEVEDQNVEKLSGSSPKHLFDLNLPPEPEEGDIDILVPNLVNPPTGDNI
ncbi:unnamed protein product [Lactuca virosa]|uniref:Uncharacterized protein n=1 Tax=Lactuca virosa TaxID=75947 RepID=A0AAU9LUG2_9ASTR|nr:unnamed protein product [Lactuca virosa]